MYDEIPNIDNLFETLHEEAYCPEFQETYGKIVFIADSYLKELSEYYSPNEYDESIDYRHYILIFLFRTMRIFCSILILIFYKRMNE